MTKPLAELMREDPLTQAEALTGKSYKEDEGTSALGFLLHLAHVDEVKEAAEAEADTYYSSGFERSLGIFLDLGFDVVQRQPFKNDTETFVILWHPDGILGTLESYMGDKTNTAKIFYNVEFPDIPDHRVTSSGRYVVFEEGRKVWAGDHDARTGLRSSIAGLREQGRFLNPWVERPWLSLIDYDTYRGFDRESENWQVRMGLADEHRDKVIASLPERVRVAISPEVAR